MNVLGGLRLRSEKMASELRPGDLIWWNRGF
jgi:hypothetical protein